MLFIKLKTAFAFGETPSLKGGLSVAVLGGQIAMGQRGRGQVNRSLFFILEKSTQTDINNMRGGRIGLRFYFCLTLNSIIFLPNPYSFYPYVYRLLQRLVIQLVTFP